MWIVKPYAVLELAVRVLHDVEQADQLSCVSIGKAVWCSGTYNLSIGPTRDLAALGLKSVVVGHVDVIERSGLQGAA